MPTSVPGHFNRRGFTLIELLVVLLVMGLCAGLVAALAQPDDRARLRVEAERLAQLLDLAALESRFSGKPIAWTAAATQYRFWRWRDDGGWSEASQGSTSDPLRARSLPQGIAIPEMRIEFDPYVPAAYEVRMTLGEARYVVAGSPLGEVRIHEPR
jgi:general secretion pathway protein H